ncbi:MAG: hypothetical protein M0Z33_06820 [Actinomycetota bacterium]|nr:hypothetical protein [Actinomycetota bacterium]
MPVQRHYVDHRRYAEPPARLADLAGPTSGQVGLPVTIDGEALVEVWGRPFLPRRVRDMWESRLPSFVSAA